jgi:hypothetical protein
MDIHGTTLLVRDFAHIQTAFHAELVRPAEHRDQVGTIGAGDGEIVAGECFAAVHVQKTHTSLSSGSSGVNTAIPRWVQTDTISLTARAAPEP